jgi:hypothetical protein
LPCELRAVLGVGHQGFLRLLLGVRVLLCVFFLWYKAGFPMYTFCVLRGALRSIFFFFFNILKKKKLWSSNLMQWKKGLRSVLLQTPKENERGKEWP